MPKHFLTFVIGCSKQALELAERETLLKEQLHTYGDKFKDLQETLTKSTLDGFAT